VSHLIRDTFHFCKSFSPVLPDPVVYGEVVLIAFRALLENFGLLLLVSILIAVIGADGGDGPTQRIASSHSFGSKCELDV
jgi:hypothetical protein